MMIYVSHPFEGEEENKKVIEEIFRKAAKVDSSNTYNSPALSYGFLYNEIDHNLWIDYSIDLMMGCDKVYFFGDINSSLDCKIDLQMCKRLNKPYKIFKGEIII